MALSLGPEGRKLIQNWEGLRLKAYLCPAGVLTIGFGHTGRDVKPGMTITRERAEQLFDNDVKWAVQAVNAAVKTPINQREFDALVSFCFNVGAGNFRGSTLLRYLNAGKKAEAAKQFDRWVFGANKRKLAGLVNRRKAERTMFTTPLVKKGT